VVETGGRLACERTYEFDARGEFVELRESLNGLNRRVRPGKRSSV
jgi:hypothetical protein